MTESGQEILNDFSGTPRNKHVTGVPQFLIGIHHYSERLLVRICKSIETKEVIHFLESFINTNGVFQQTKPNTGSDFFLKTFKELHKNKYCVSTSEATHHHEDGRTRNTNAKDLGYCHLRR